MKIAINDIIIDTIDICSITEVKVRHKFGHGSDYPRSYKVRSFEINFYKGRGETLEYRVNPDDSVAELVDLRDKILKIWSNNQLDIPHFKI